MKATVLIPIQHFDKWIKETTSADEFENEEDIKEDESSMHFLFKDTMNRWSNMNNSNQKTANTHI